MDAPDKILTGRHFFGAHFPGLHFDPKDEEDKDEKEESKTIEDSVDKAAKDLESKKKDTEEEKDDEKETDDTKDDEKEDDDDEDEDEEFDKTSLTEAKNLYRHLKNPKTAVETLKILVRSAGLDIKEATREEKKEVEKTIKAVVKQKLGTKYPTLSEDLGDMLEEILDFAVKEKIKPLEQVQQAERDQRLKEKIDNAERAVKAEFTDIPDKVLKEADRLLESKEFVPPKDANPEKVFRALFQLAAANTDIVLQKTTAKHVNTKKQDDDDVFAQLHSKRAGAKDGVRDVQVKSLDDAVKLAEQQVEAKMKNK